MTTQDPMAPPSATARALEKQERLARVYDAEIAPVYASRFADLLAGALGPPRPGARVVEAGCATGALTLELVRRFDAASRFVAVDEAPFVTRARARLEAERAADRVRFEVGPASPLALPDAAGDVVVSNLEAAAAADPAGAVRELARVAAPGAVVALTVPLRGSWAEFLDIYREVLLDNGTPASVEALDREVAATPDAATAAAWLEGAGLVDVELTVERWEILFRSAREFFFAPLVELGPLSRWKRIAGRGEDMQDVFFFTKEAIDTYFRGGAFPVTIVGAALRATKPAPR